MSNFALANPGTLGTSLQEFFELRSKNGGASTKPENEIFRFVFGFRVL